MNISISNAIQSSAISGGGEPSALPLALDLSITGGFAIGDVQTGNYTYFDPNGVAESGTTFKWYRVDGSTRTEIGTAQTYTLAADDNLKAIEFEVTPRNADPLVGPTSFVQKNIPQFPVPPTATNVSFAGTLEVGQQMQGSYDYGDLNGDAESGTTFKWWRADNAAGTLNRTEISGATLINYTLVSPADEGKYIQFQVTPRNSIGEIGNMSASSWRGAVDSLPVASNVTYTGNNNVGELLSSSFDYSDANSAPQGTSLYQWLTSTTSGGAGTPISGATSANYTVATIDEGNFLSVRVTPVTSSGIQGLPVSSGARSNAVGPLPGFSTNPSFTGTLTEGQLLTGSYTYNTSSATEGISTFKWYNDGVAISGATSLTYTLQTSDIGDDISFEVTPVSNTGVQGTAVTSAAQGPIINSGYVLNNLEMLLDFTDTTISNNKQYIDDDSTNSNRAELFTGKALYFDGTTFYLDVSGFSMGGNNATFSFWANIDKVIKGDYFFDFHSSTTRFILGFGQTSKKLAVYSASGQTDAVWQDFGHPPQDQWVRIVLTVNGTTAKCFVDGVQLGTSKTIYTYDFSSQSTAHIGARYLPETTPKYFDGLLSDFQVYDKVWLNDDIAYDYANPQNLVTDRDNTTIALSNLKAYWAMSEGAGSLAYDSSGEGNNGTLNGATYEPAQPRIPQLGMMNWSKGSNLFRYSEDFTEWVISASTSQVLLAATEAAPYGQGDVYSITMQSSENDAYIRYATNNATLTSSTHSVWVKQSPTGSATHIRITNNNKAAWNTGTSKKIALTSSWQRIETTDAITGNRFTIIGSANASGTQDSDCIGKALIYGAQLVEGSSAGAYRFTDGAATSNSTVIPNPTIPTKDIFGNAVRDRDDSFNLDGIGYATIADSTSLNISNGTLQFWLKTTDTAFTILSGQSSSEFIGKANVTWFNNNAGTITVYKDNTTASSNNTPDTDGNWHFYTFTGINVSTWTEFNISNLATFELDGLLDSVFIYSDVLTSAEIIQNYNFTEPDHQ